MAGAPTPSACVRRHRPANPERCARRPEPVHAKAPARQHRRDAPRARRRSPPAPPTTTHCSTASSANTIRRARKCTENFEIERLPRASTPSATARASPAPSRRRPPTDSTSRTASSARNKRHGQKREPSLRPVLFFVSGFRPSGRLPLEGIAVSFILHRVDERPDGGVDDVGRTRRPSSRRSPRRTIRSGRAPSRRSPSRCP